MRQQAAPGAPHRPRHQRQHRLHIPPVVLRFIHRRLRDKRAMPKARVVQQPAKRLQPHRPVSYMLMPIQPRPAYRFRVIHVPNPHRLQPHAVPNPLHRLLISLAAHQIVARHMAMAGVEARAHRNHRPQLLNQLRHLLETPAQRKLRPRRVLDQHAKIAVVEPHPIHRPRNRLRRPPQTLLARQPLPRSGMQHQILRAQRQRPLHLAAKRQQSTFPGTVPSGCTGSPDSWCGSPAARSRTPSAAAASARSGSPPAAAPATSAGSTRKSETYSRRSRALAPPREKPRPTSTNESQCAASPLAISLSVQGRPLRSAATLPTLIPNH